MENIVDETMCGQSNRIMWAEVKAFFLVTYIVGEKNSADNPTTREEVKAFFLVPYYVGEKRSADNPTLWAEVKALFFSTLQCGRKFFCGQSNHINNVGRSENMLE